MHQFPVQASQRVPTAKKSRWKSILPVDFILPVVSSFAGVFCFAGGNTSPMLVYFCFAGGNSVCRWMNSHWQFLAVGTLWGTCPGT